MCRFVRIGSATVLATLGVGFLQRALDLQGFGGELGEVGFLILTMLLVSLSDREFLWGLPPKHESRR